MDTVNLTSKLGSIMSPLGLGFVLGIIYDFVRVLRLFVPSKKVFVFVTDAVFVLFCTVSSYLMFIALTDGRIRAYMVVAEVIGAAVYKFGIGFFVFCVFEKISVFVKRVVRKIFSPFLFVFRKIKNFAAKKLKKVGEKLKKCKNKFKKPLQDESEMLYNISD